MELALNRTNYVDRISEIRRLFQDVFGRDMSGDFFRWRYWNNVYQDVSVSVFEKDRRLFGHYASTPGAFQVGSRAVRAEMVAAVMTHASLQGQGVFQRLGRHHESSAREKGCGFLYAFPNKISDPIFIHKLGWKSVYEIPTLSVTLATLDFRERPAPDFRFDNGFERCDYDTLTDRSGLIVNRRTTDFLRWRYTSNPLHEYANLLIADGRTLRAYAVVKIYTAHAKRSLDVMDFFAFGDTAWPELTDAILHYARAQECVDVNLWSPRHHPSHQYFIKCGFAHRLPVTYLTVKALDADLDARLGNFSNWWITMGDSDVY